MICDYKVPVMAAAVLALSACAGPIETRINTAVQEPPARGASYYLSVPEGPVGPMNAEAAKLLEARLASLGLSRIDDPEKAQYAAALTVADRPADMSYAAADIALATAKKRRALQSCKDREVHVAFVLTRIADASSAYRGSAAEYHCKAQTAEVMPLLLDKALSGFSGEGFPGLVGARVEQRQGVE